MTSSSFSSLLATLSGSRYHIGTMSDILEQNQEETLFSPVTKEEMWKRAETRASVDLLMFAEFAMLFPLLKPLIQEGQVRRPWDSLMPNYFDSGRMERERFPQPNFKTKPREMKCSLLWVFFSVENLTCYEAQTGGIFTAVTWKCESINKMLTLAC